MTDDPDSRDVIDRERLLHDPRSRRDAALVADLLDPEFREIGASGRLWDRAAILAMMTDADPPPPSTDRFVTTRLGDDVMLLTYRSRRDRQTVLRSSLWRRQDGGEWRVCFHQGTPVPAQSAGAAGAPEA